MGWSINRPTGLTFHRPNLSTKGYTLLTPHGDTATYLIDMDGQVVHRWLFHHIMPGYGRLLTNGNLLMTGSDVNLPAAPKDEPTKAPLPFEQHITRLGGYHTTLCELDWEGNIVWEYENRSQHHDFYRFENGNTMVPEWVELPEELHRKVRGGYKMPRERLPRLLGDDLVEINPAGIEVRRIHTWQLLDPIKDPITPNTRRWEWTHLNGFDVNANNEIVFLREISTASPSSMLRVPRFDGNLIEAGVNTTQLGSMIRSLFLTTEIHPLLEFLRSTRQQAKSTGTITACRSNNSTAAIFPAHRDSVPETH